MHLNKLYGALNIITITLIISGCTAASDTSLTDANGTDLNTTNGNSLTVTADAVLTTDTTDTTDTTVPEVDTTAPSIPSNIHLANSPTTSSVELVWNASTDDTGISHYELLRGTTVLSASIDSTSYTDSNVFPNMNYSYVVKAVDLSGNFSTSNAFVVTTPASDGPQPVVTSTSPANGATKVSPNLGEIIVSFDEVMDPTSINSSSFTLDNGLTGTISMINGNTQAKFTPSSNLSRGTTYTATLSGVTGDSGSELTPNSQQVYSWSFNTCGDTATSTYTLTWDAVNDNDLSSYKIIYGSTSDLSESNSNSLNVGNVTSMVLNPSTLGFKPCDTVYMTVVAAGSTKDESAFSNMASVTID